MAGIVYSLLPSSGKGKGSLRVNRRMLRSKISVSLCGKFNGVVFLRETMIIKKYRKS
jgi:hypothetical protein